MLNEQERRLAFAFLFTMPGAPYLYYGDEIGMNYRWLPTKEGGYHRTGSRTPMQWAKGENLGFSTAAPEKLYLPVDPALDAPTVQAQEEDSDSLLQFVRKLIAFRKSQKDLQSDKSFAVYSAEKGSRLFAYKRGQLLIAVNPGLQPLTLPLDQAYRLAYAVGTPRVEKKELLLPPQSFAVLTPCE